MPRVGVEGVKTWCLSRRLGTQLPPTPPTSQALVAVRQAGPSCSGTLGLTATGQGNGQEEMMGVREEGGASLVTVSGGGWAP